MYNKNRFWVFAIVLFIAVASLQLLSVSSTQATLSEDVLIQRALEEAKIIGTQDVSSIKDLSQYQIGYVNLEDWVKLNGGQLGPDASKVGMNPDRQLFIMAIEGNVVNDSLLSIPGITNTKTVVIGIYTDTGDVAYSGIEPVGASLKIQHQGAFQYFGRRS